MACEGVVMARTSKGVPVYLVPWAYITALERASSTSGYDWRSTHTTGALHKAGSYATAHHM